MSNKAVLYHRPYQRIKRSSFKQTDICFSRNSHITQSIISNTIPSVFRERYLVINTNCPLFAWMTYNVETYRALVQLGFLKDKPFESALPPEHGFNVLSYVMKNHFVFNSTIMNAVHQRRKAIGNGSCVAFHIRMGNLNSDFRDSHSFLKQESLPYFSNCSVLSEYPGVPIFVASDSSSAKKVIRQITPAHKVISFNTKAGHTESYSFNYLNTHLTNSLIDLMTLGSCDVLVGTTMSTFSVLASSLIGKLPYLVDGKSTCHLPRGLLYF